MTTFARGDMVKLAQNNTVTGQIVSEREWGAHYLVRLGEMPMPTEWFNACEIEKIDSKTDNTGSGNGAKVLKFGGK